MSQDVIFIGSEPSTSEKGNHNNLEMKPTNANEKRAQNESTISDETGNFRKNSI